jgi:hypothetical protein
MLGTLAWTQTETPLGDLARDARRQKTPRSKVVVSDDELRTSAPPPETKADAKPGAAKTAAKSAAPAAAAKDEGKEAPDESGKDAEKAQGFRQRVVEQKKAIGTLEKEVDLLQREMALQTAQFYADAGTQLRNGKDWAERRKKFEDEIATKKTALTAAKEKLDDIREEARRAGLASSVTE